AQLSEPYRKISARINFSQDRIAVRGDIPMHPSQLLRNQLMSFFFFLLCRSINFGALGSIIGHELSHAFDNQGRQFNAKGDLKNWWTKRALAEFKNRTACLANWFQKFSAAGNRENGQQTVGENIADGGGLRAAYTAYNIWEKEHGPEGNLPTVNLTSQQLFFTAFAQVRPFCQPITFHSPARFRVLGTLSNSPEFSQHFHCPLDSPMNPSRKCTLW
uniref:Peptidase M13 C-terminal domain-containing protein n=1 Tax=Eptatretus burgeri TaxID=7764 RepID=A0A8C4WR77_EPTBU